MSVGVGDRAPAFTLPGTGERTYSLAEYAGRPIVLVFYPGDDTPVCTKQLNTYNQGLDQFTDLGAQVLAISAQDIASHERFSAEQGGFAFPLLADTDKAVAAVVRHARAARLSSTQRVHRRRRWRHPLRPPGHRRADLPPDQRARRGLVDAVNQRRDATSADSVHSVLLGAASPGSAAQDLSGGRGGPPRPAAPRLPYEPVFAGSVPGRVLGIDPGLTRCGYAVVDGAGPQRRRPRRDPHAGGDAAAAASRRLA